MGKSVCDEEGSECGHFLTDENAPLPEDVAAENYRVRAITHSLAELTFRERRVIELRYGFDGHTPATLDEVGEIFNVTRERIRQIEKRCLTKLSESSELQDLHGVA